MHSLLTEHTLRATTAERLRAAERRPQPPPDPRHPPPRRARRRVAVLLIRAAGRLDPESARRAIA